MILFYVSNEWMGLWLSLHRSGTVDVLYIRHQHHNNLLISLCVHLLKLDPNEEDKPQDSLRCL